MCSGAYNWRSRAIQGWFADDDASSQHCDFVAVGAGNGSGHSRVISAVVLWQNAVIDRIATGGSPWDVFCPEPADGLVAIDDLQNLFARQGMAAKMGELGLACEDVDKLLPALIKNKGEAFGGFKKLTIDGAIYPLAF